MKPLYYVKTAIKEYIFSVSYILSCMAAILVSTECMTRMRYLQVGVANVRPVVGQHILGMKNDYFERMVPC